MLKSYNSAKYHQGLIDEWNDPKDIVQRAAVLIKEIHLLYGRLAFEVFQMLQNNNKLPKKQNVQNRRKLVKKYAKQKMSQSQIAKKLDVSLSTIEKDVAILRN